MTEDIKEALEVFGVPLLWRLYYEGLVTDKMRDYLLRIEYEQIKCETKSGSYESMRELAEKRHLGFENVKRIVYRKDV